MHMNILYIFLPLKDDEFPTHMDISCVTRAIRSVDHVRPIVIMYSCGYHYGIVVSVGHIHKIYLYERCGH